MSTAEHARVIANRRAAEARYDGAAIASAAPSSLSAEPVLRQARAAIRWLVFGEKDAQGFSPRVSDALSAIDAALAPPAQAPAIQAPEAVDWPKLDKPARVVGTFGVGVSAGFVVRAAQRHYEATEAERLRTPLERRDDELRRRAGWDLFNGYASLEGNTPSAAVSAGEPVPEGWKLVPIQDTPKMWTAGGNAIAGCGGHARDAASLAYAAMLDAAPAPTQPQQGTGSGKP